MKEIMSCMSLFYSLEKCTMRRCHSGTVVHFVDALIKMRINPSDLVSRQRTNQCGCVCVCVFGVFQAPLNTQVTEDRFAILTEKYRIPVPILPGKVGKFLRTHFQRYTSTRTRWAHIRTVLNPLHQAEKSGFACEMYWCCYCNLFP